MADRKHKGNTKPDGKEPEEKKQETTLGFTGLLGVVLLAGALFNIPAILKVPETDADKMMLVIVLAMALGGVVLIIFRKKQ